ncbi:MAG: type I-E CRISPR-associated endonuclease Cas1e [Lyngbya sp. HA4199-MV5]|jgi:CRISPR-associated protein Cas1|nr:type I-E CRISPR-associated endonuclease Cas1e [Lyngbya sp. HA4199-MV5]
MSRRTLPKVRDSISFLYFEHCRIEQDVKAIAIFQAKDRYRIPCASISTLMLGPGTSITHAAIKTLAENACEVQWVGEEALRFYTSGQGNVRNTERLFRQARLWADSLQRLAVVRRMYQFRFQEDLSSDLTLQQIRGLEGVRVRTLYGRLSRETGVEWKGRDYKQTDWNEANPINKALSIANACLYAVCQAAMTSVGYSTALGFIHTGKPLSFIYDIADLYKAETSIPAAFEAVAETYFDLEEIVRRKCREKFFQARLMQRMIQDVDRVLQYNGADEMAEPVCFLWDDRVEQVEGGKDWSEGQ